MTSRNSNPSFDSDGGPAAGGFAFAADPLPGKPREAAAFRSVSWPDSSRSLPRFCGIEAGSRGTVHGEENRGKKSTAGFLDDDAVGEIIRATQASEQSTVLTAPRKTLRDGEKGSSSSRSSRPCQGGLGTEPVAEPFSPSRSVFRARGQDRALLGRLRGPDNLADSIIVEKPAVDFFPGFLHREQFPYFQLSIRRSAE